MGSGYGFRVRVKAVVWLLSLGTLSRISPYAQLVFVVIVSIWRAISRRMLRCRRVSLAMLWYDQSYDVPPRPIGRGTGSIWNAALSYKQKPPRIIIDDWIIPVIISP